MRLDELQAPNGTLPDTHVAVPLSVQQLETPLRVCVVLQRDAEGLDVVRVRELIDAVVLLGCVTDSGGTVREWLEIWVQQVRGINQSLPVVKQGLCNSIIDDRWARLAEGVARIDPASVIRTGYERTPGLPLWIDARTLTPWHASDPKLGPYRLCTDERVLAEAGLPPYASTLHRYLIAGGGEERPARFAMVTEGSPVNDSTVALQQLVGKPGEHVPINPEGGLVVLRRHLWVSLESFVDFLGGAPVEESLMRSRRPPQTVRAEGSAAADEPSAGVNDGWLGSAGSGGASRLLEALHLKVCLIADCIASVRRFVASVQFPLLNLTADSFRVQLGNPGSQLPAFWTARGALVNPGETVEITVPGSDGRYFMPARSLGGSPYRTVLVGRRLEGWGSVRIRDVQPISGGTYVLEGTLSSQDRLRFGRADLVWMRLSFGRSKIDLWARVETESSLAAGEYRFRTLEQRLTQSDLEKVEDFKGQIIGDVPYDLLPALSTPCDLYSLAVLALRVLLVNQRRSLSIVVDDMVTLVNRLKLSPHKGPMAERIERVISSDARWLELLGPQNAMYDAGAARPHADAVPRSLWWEILGVILRMLPGMSSEAYTSDFGEAPAGAVHKVFDAAIADWRALAIKTRSLLVTDWRGNREIADALRQQATLVRQQTASARSSSSPTTTATTTAKARGPNASRAALSAGTISAATPGSVGIGADGIWADAPPLPHAGTGGTDVGRHGNVAVSFAVALGLR